MLELAKGGNTTVGPGPVTVELSVEGDTVDLSALLVTANGKVRSDDDLVFYNQPSAESGAVRHLAADVGSLERIEVDTAALPADVDRVVLVASLRSRRHVPHLPRRKECPCQRPGQR
ncbi:hypothetical protein SGRIM128S_02567 [Streptomyces griseomycini]